MPGQTANKLSVEKYRRIAWAMCIADLFLLILLVGLYILNRGDILSLINTAASTILVIVGAVIITRQPRNFVGWGMIAAGLMTVGADLLTQYAIFTLIVHPGLLPFGVLASWISAWIWLAPAFLAIPLLLLFPNGTLLTPYWRWAIIAAALLVSTMILIAAAASWPQRGIALLEFNNPQTTTMSPTSARLWQVLGSLQFLLVFLVVIALAGLALRFYRSRGIERQQLKWFVLACLLFPISIALPNSSSDPLANILIHIANLAPVILIPAAIGIAVTRYQLYEIDVIIRRTLVYSILTLLLALVYFGMVFLLQEGFIFLSGQRSPVSIVISTLLIAVLFNPLRKSIQNGIDRRFYRRKYDSEKMIQSFVNTIRNQVELDQLTDHLVSVVDITMQPEHISLWMRETSK